MRKAIVDLVRNGEVDTLMENIRSGEIDAEEAGQLVGEFIYQATCRLNEEDTGEFYNMVADSIEDEDVYDVCAISLDYAVDAEDPIADAKEFAAEYGCEAEVIVENSWGGWPTIKFVGYRKDLYKLVKAYDEEGCEELLKLLKEI